jgi:hypothetical protein
MKKLINLVALAIIVVSASSFTFIDSAEMFATSASKEFVDEKLPPVHAPNDKEIEKRNVADFSIVSLSISADVYITQGNQTSLEIQASEKSLKNLVTKVDGDELNIKWNRNNYSNGEITIRITMQEIEGFNIAGSGNIFANSAIKCNEIELSIAGSGDIKLKDISANEITSNVAGSGNVVLGGNNKVRSHSINIAGSGDVSAKKLEVNEVTVSIAGSGDCYVHAVEELEVNIIGSGDVYYYGSPEVESNVMGSGDIEKL